MRRDSMAIAEIQVKNRLREDIGDIGGLAQSIKSWGLIHPIVVDDAGRLIAGQRRIEACKRLGMKRVDVRYFGELSAAERREIEDEENLHRKDLTAYERSKKVKEITDRAKAESAKTLPESGTVSKGRRGPAKNAQSTKSVAKKTGIPRQTIHDAEAHVAAAERYPVLQGPDWTQSAAMRTAKVLDDIPSKDRRRILSLVSDVHAPAREAARMVDQWSRTSPDRRERLWNTARNGDSRSRSIAITTLARTAPEPDPRAVYLVGVIRTLERFVRQYPNDPNNDGIRRHVVACKKLHDAIEAEHQSQIHEASV